MSTENTNLNIENARMWQRHETKKYWDSSEFIPAKGEIVVYDAEVENGIIITPANIKIGDGETDVAALPFTYGGKGVKGDKGDPGPKGEDGTMRFEDLTPDQKASLKGDKGDQGIQGPKGD